MYYTTSGAYRKAKMFIDYANVFLTLCIVVLFVLILLFGSKNTIMFPLIFFAGAIINANCAVKRFMDKQKVGAIIRVVVTLALVALSVLCLLTVL